eukprot:GEMP01061062.1.p1 GENE.GEMP01061062.1~~GEMP01061062.1.p1  ORF type:complete len:222 (+),score=34.76 GEMP01061062.1:49-666(+)
MLSSLHVDLAKSKKGQEISETFLNATEIRGGISWHQPDDLSEKGRAFRDFVLPIMCSDAFENPIPDLVGEEFTTWLLSAEGRTETHKGDYRGEMSFLRHKKVEESQSSSAVREDYIIAARFKENPNKYEKICKRILGESGFQYIRRWKVCRNLFQKEKIREEPLTMDEVECLFEYGKYKVLKSFRPNAIPFGATLVDEKGTPLEC